MQRSRGFSLVEVLIALLILGFVLTTALAVFYERERRLLAAEELLIASQIFEIEAEFLRHTAFSDLPITGSRSFVSTPQLLSRLPDAIATEAIELEQSSLKKVTMRLSWNGGRNRSELVIYRSDTGGGNLW